MKVAVLGLQGAAREHRHMVESLGHVAVDVRKPEHLAGADALVLPGGESTTMSMLLESSGLFDPVAEFVASGAPVFGTCAGMILLADHVLDGRPDQRTFSALRLSVKRNGFGRQTASFEADLDVKGLDTPYRAVFIRAPLVTEIGPDIDVLATVTGDDGNQYPALCRKGSIVVSAFHPELTDDARLHGLWLGA